MMKLASSTSSKSTPNTVPSTETRPPDNGVPPITAAAIASSSNCTPI